MTDHGHENESPTEFIASPRARVQAGCSFAALVESRRKHAITIHPASFLYGQYVDWREQFPPSLDYRCSESHASQHVASFS